MIKGIILAVVACFIWGLIFVIPGFMTGFSALEVALGRHGMYGIASLLIFSYAFLKTRQRYSKAVWGKAFLFSIVSTVGYYTSLVLALRYASPAICALIVGISPITIALYGNWIQKEMPFKVLIIPSLIILTGLILVNIPSLTASSSTTTYLLGIFFALLALLGWSWFAVANARFLRTHPEIHSGHWSTLIGVGAFFWVTLLSTLLILFFPHHLQGEHYFTLHPTFLTFIGGSAILGILCSWVGAFLWNKSCLHLPISLAGQLLVFETLFGLMFAYLVTQTYPSLLECTGIIILLSGITYGTHQFTKKKLDPV